MIARMWHGRVPREKSEEYHAYLLETGLNDYVKVEGNQGIKLLKRDEGATTHFYTWSYWDSYDSIKEFAGKDFEKARYYEEDKKFLLEFEPLVTHYEVLNYK